MQYIGNCLHCGGEMKSVSIGWKCMSCGALLDMKHNWHLAVNEPFIPDDVLKEQDEAAGGKYRRAIERIGRFGELFVEYKGDPRGPMGRAGGMSIVEEAQIMPVITDVDGGTWRPVQEEVLQDLLKQLDYWKEKNFKACYEKGALSARAEEAESKLKDAIELLRGMCSACKHYSAYRRKDKCLNCWRAPFNPACLREYQEDYWEWKHD